MEPAVFNRKWITGVSRSAVPGMGHRVHGIIGGDANYKIFYDLCRTHYDREAPL